LIDAVWSGNFERGEIVPPVGSITSKLSGTKSGNARCASSSPAQISSIKG
jgi:hypothetical protein